MKFLYGNLLLKCHEKLVTASLEANMLQLAKKFNYAD